jgi:predicted nucleotidyltransferase
MHEILLNLKKKLLNDFRKDIHEIILFGSHVYGIADQSSDYDILIILNVSYDWKYRRKVLDACFDFEIENDIFLDVKIISLDELKNSAKGLNPLYEEALSKGTEI